MFEKEKKYFPIKTETACPLKWGWSSLFLKNGTTSSCHRCEKLDINVENFNEFHNLPTKLKEREIMLKGKWPTVENGGTGHCNFCKKHEDIKKISDRQRQLTVPNMHPKELNENVRETKVTPTILELYLNNTCNMKCTYCTPNLSSLWQNELDQHGKIQIDNRVYHEKKTFEKNIQQKLFEKTLSWLSSNGQHLKRLHILGGEPFYQKEFDILLDHLGKHKFPNLELNVISNLMTKENIFFKYHEKIKHLVTQRVIGRYDLTVSIDNWGEEAEYARTGLKLKHFIKLFEFCANEKWIKMNINTTVTNLTIKTFPDLVKYVLPFKKNKNIEFFGGELVGTLTDLLHPEIYGQKFWEKDFDRILKILPNQTDQDKLTIDIYEGIFKSLPKHKNMHRIKLFKNYLDILDSRRNTNWREVYPYLDI